MTSMLRPRAIAALLLLAATAGCGSATAASEEAAPTPVEEAAPATFTVTGSITVVGASYADSAVTGEECTTTTDSDPIGGLQVVLENDSGTTLALATLSETGSFTSSSSTDGWYAPCAFAFKFNDVPEGEAFYTLTAGDLGEMKYSREDLNEPVELGLG